MVMTLNAGEDMERLGHSYIALWNRKWYSHSGGEYDSFLNTKHTLTLKHSSQTLGYLSQTCGHTKLRT